VRYLSRFVPFPGLLALLPLLLSSAGCDPCFGTLACTGEPRISYEGELIQQFTTFGDPAAGVQVEFIRTGGARLTADTLKAVSDSTGRFRLETLAREQGTVRGDLVIRPGPFVGSMRVRDLELTTTAARGEVRHLGSWHVPHLHFGAMGEFFNRGNRQIAPNVRVEVRRTGGIRIEPESWVTFSDPGGRFAINPRPLEPGTVELELIVRSPVTFLLDTIPNVRVSTMVTRRTDPVIGRWGVGPHLPFAGLLRWGDTLQPAVGVEVEVRRVEGVVTYPDRYTTTTNSAGTFSLGPVPHTLGDVVFELDVRPPAPYRAVTIRDVRVRSIERDGFAILVGQWLIPRR
jgi:hypothetical protein